MESMVKFLRGILKDADLQTVSKGDLRKKYLEANDLTDLSKTEKKMFSEAVINVLSSEFEILEKQKLDVKEVEIEKGSGKDSNLDSDDDFSPVTSKRKSEILKKNASKILSDSEDDVSDIKVPFKNLTNMKKEKKMKGLGSPVKQSPRVENEDVPTEVESNRSRDLLVDDKAKYAKRKILESSDSDGETDVKPLKKARQSTNSKKSSVKSSIDPISDSEEEPIIKQKRKESSKGSSGMIELEKDKAIKEKEMKEKSFLMMDISDSEDKVKNKFVDESNIDLEDNSDLGTNNQKLKNKSIESDDSEEELFQKLVRVKSTKQNLSESDSDLETEPLSKVANKGLKNKSGSIESSDSEDESIAQLASSKQNKKLYKPDIDSDTDSESLKSDEGSESESDLDFKKSISKLNKIKSVKKELDSSADSEDEPIVKLTKKKSKYSVGFAVDSPKVRKQKKKNISPIKKELNSSDDSENEPIIKLKNKSKDSIRSAEDSPRVKNLKKKNTSSVKKESFEESSNSSVEDDDEKPSMQEQKNKFNKGSKAKASKEKESSTQFDNRLEHLKKYVRAAGIRIHSYTKLFENCKSMKAKIETLMGLLKKQGMKGRPTLAKCKKLKKKIETKKEISELDLSNILKADAHRPRRSGSMDTSNSNKQEKSPTPVKHFSRLKGIIDSEESD